jgi:hypothetical protein
MFSLLSPLLVAAAIVPLLCYVRICGPHDVATVALTTPAPDATIA